MCRIICQKSPSYLHMSSILIDGNSTELCRCSVEDVECHIQHNQERPGVCVGGGVHKYNSIIKCTQVCVCISTVTYLKGHIAVQRGHIQLRTWSTTTSTTRRDLVCVGWVGGFGLYINTTV